MKIGRLSGVMMLTLALLATAHVYAQDDSIKKRQKLMKSNSSASKAIKAAIGKKDFPAVETKAKHIAENVSRLEKLFPKGTLSPESRAKAAIWEKWDEFAKDAEAAKTAAGDLAAAAAAKDAAAVEEKAKVLGKSCSSCHKTFRAPKKK